MEPLRIAFKAIKRLTGYFILRPLQRYNIEERAFKKLEKQTDVIKPAPKHQITQELLERIQREHPEIMENIKKEPPELMKRLTEVKVHSIGQDPVLKVDKSKLPEYTRTRHGYVPAIVVPTGKVSMQMYCEMLNLRRHNPFIYTAPFFAERYNVDMEHIEDLLDHFRAFQVYSPAEIPKSRVPWWAPKNVEEFLMEGFAPYHHAQIEMEEKLDEEGRKRQEEARLKRLEEQKVEAAKWFASQKEIADGGTSRKAIEGEVSPDLQEPDKKEETVNKK